MGDIADYLFDIALEEEIRKFSDIQNILSMSNKELVDATINDRKDIIVGIRSYFFIYDKLSDKQRYCLARSIADDRDDDDI